MAEHVVQTQATRRDVVAALRRIPQLVNTQGAAQAAVRGVLERVGMAALARIRDAFVVRSRGGTDAAGERWRPLSTRTVAYSRKHPGRRKDPGQRPSGALTETQRKRWWEMYKRFLARFEGDKGHAAAATWLVLKDEGATTLLQKYGAMQVDILRSTGLLLNSLSPGVIGGVENQVFRLEQAAVVVGTNRKGALGHHEGIPGRLPQRRLWPVPGRWPSLWWRDIAEQAKEGLVELVVQQVRAS